MTSPVSEYFPSKQEQNRPDLEEISGTGKGPRAWLFLRLFCVLMLVTQGVGVGFFVAAVIDPVWTDQSLRGHPDQIAFVRAFCIFFVMVFGVPLLPMIPMLFIPRGRWGWYLGATALGCGIFTTCGWPLAIPLIVYWFHPEVKQYSGLGGKGGSV